VEPAGIEPATSCLQTKNRGCVQSFPVANVPANPIKLAAPERLSTTLHDKLVHPSCTLVSKPGVTSRRTAS
jgi:hypothetical protein